MIYIVHVDEFKARVPGGGGGGGGGDIHTMYTTYRNINFIKVHILLYSLPQPKFCMKHTKL